MNQPWFVVAIVAIVMLATVLKARYRHVRTEGEPAERLEAERLRDEVKQLKERIQTLERITVDKENSLSREIEELRQRP